MTIQIIQEINVPHDAQPGSAGMTLADLRKFLERCDALKMSEYETIPRFHLIGTTGEVRMIEASK